MDNPKISPNNATIHHEVQNDVELETKVNSSNVTARSEGGGLLPATHDNRDNAATAGLTD